MLNTPMTILVVDDNAEFMETIKLVLEYEDFEVKTALDGKTALKIIPQIQPALILLDIILPDIDGFTLCREIRRSSDIPIIMLTGMTGEAEKITGLETGADDYLIKPFSNKELVTRIKTVLRRSSSIKARHEYALYRCADLKIDFIRQSVTLGEEKIELSATEYRLLSYLAFRSGEILSFEEILKEIWGDENGADIDLLRVNICRLRHKLQEHNSHVKYIETIPGRGYFFKKAI
jgi:DNA-binding response OmpR family regulator